MLAALVTGAAFVFAYAAIVLMLERQDRRRAERDSPSTPELE